MNQLFGGFGDVVLGKQGSPCMTMELYSDYGSTKMTFGGNTGLIHPTACTHWAFSRCAHSSPCKHIRNYWGNLAEGGEKKKEKQKGWCVCLFSLESFPQTISQRNSTHAAHGPEQQAALERGKS